MPFTFICSNIPAASAYGVYIFHLMQNSRACGSYHGFIYRVLWLIMKLLNQWPIVAKLKSSLRTFYVTLVCNKSNTMGVTSGAGIACYNSGGPELTTGFKWGFNCLFSV